jgi:hypothetical protein
MRSATPRSSPSGSCEKRTVPSQQRPAFRYDATHPPASVLRTGRAGYAWNRLRRGTSAAAGWPWRVRYQRKCRLVSAKLVRLLRADPSTQLPLWLTAQQFVRMRQRSAFSQGAVLCHVRGRELEFVRMRQWSASSQVRRSVFPKRRCIVRAKASGAIPCRAATDRA